MGKNDNQKRTDNLIAEDRARQQQEHADAMARQAQASQGASQRQGEMYGSLYGGYNDLINSGGMSPDQVNQLRALQGGGGDGGGGGGGGGGPAPTAPAANIMQRFDPVVQQYKKAMEEKSTDVNALRSAKPVYDELMKTGGWDDTNRTAANWRLGELDKIAATGGLDDAAVNRMRGGGMFEEAMLSGLIDQEGMNRMRGNGVWDELAQTGGIDDPMKQMIRRRAGSPIAAGYDATRQEIERMGRVSGGGGPARAALASRLARDQARASAETSLNTELGLSDQILKGRISGAEGLTSSEQELQRQLSGNRKWGAEGMVAGEQGLQKMVGDNRLRALESGLTQQRGIVSDISGTRMGAGKETTSMEEAIAARLQDERRYGTEGMRGMIEAQLAEEQRAAAAAQAAWEAAANRSASSDRDRLNFEMTLADWQREGRLAGLGGMQGLYESKPGEVNMWEGINLAERELAGNQAATGTDQRIDNQQTRTNWWEPVSAIGGAAAGGIAGLSSLGGRTAEEERRRREGTV